MATIGKDEPVLPVRGHSFALAKDVCAGMPYDGPAWAPFNLWQTYAYSTGPANRKECARLLLYSPGARELWALIASQYDTPDTIALTLPMRCAEFREHWQATPKITPSEYRDARLKLKRHAEQLATELARFFYRWDYEGDRWDLNITQLLTEREQNTLGVFLDRDPESWRLLFGDCDDPGILPDVPEMMRRIAALFADDAKVAPLQRPHASNMERNFFARSLIRYFLDELGRFSPTIVARITSMFFAQGITDNEVLQQAPYLPDGRRIPWKGVKLPHENSG